MNASNSKKFIETEDNPPYSKKQRQLYIDRPGDMNIEKQVRLELLSQNIKDLKMHITRMEQTIEKVLDKDTSLAEKIRTLFHEEGITIISILTPFP